MTFQRLETLAKEHYITARYAGYRLHMGRELSALLMQRYKPDIGEQELTKLRDTIFGAPLLYQLMGIPIVIDVALLEGPMQWILVDATGEEIERGEVIADAAQGIVQAADGARTE